MLLSNFKRLREGVLHVLFPRTCYNCQRDLPFGSAISIFGLVFFFIPNFKCTDGIIGHDLLG